MTRALAITPLTDITTWLRGRGLEIVLLVLGAVVLAVNTWRWAGVPFRVRAGKALRRLRKEAVITFEQPPWGPSAWPATTGPTGCGSASIPTGSAWTSTSTARAIRPWSTR